MRYRLTSPLGRTVVFEAFAGRVTTSDGALPFQTVEALADMTKRIGGTLELEHSSLWLTIIPVEPVEAKDYYKVCDDGRKRNSPR